MAQNSNVLRSQEDYITQVSEEIEGTVPKKLLQQFSQNRKPPTRRTSTTWRLSHEPATSGPLRNRSGGVPERIKYKPGNEWGPLAEWSYSWSRHLPQPDDGKLWRRRWPRQKPCLSQAASNSILHELSSHIFSLSNNAQAKIWAKNRLWLWNWFVRMSESVWLIFGFHHATATCHCAMNRTFVSIHNITCDILNCYIEKIVVYIRIFT